MSIEGPKRKMLMQVDGVDAVDVVVEVAAEADPPGSKDSSERR